jgi:biphenyl-2,3-diol 1,2-dioxygenase
MSAAVTALGYLGIGASDLEAWRGYATETLGLACVERDGALLLRMDDAPWRVRIEPSDADDLSYAGFEVASSKALAEIGERLKMMDVQISAGSVEECAGRGVDALARCTDPNDIAIELYCGRASADDAFVSPRGLSFVTGDQGLGHIVLMVDDEATSRRFYEEGLGFKLSDTITMGTPPRALELTFLHCNPRHHTLALAAVPGLPKRLNHIMVQVDSMDVVGATLDLVHDHDIPLSTGLGKHTNDHMTSFYMQTPSGFDVEFGYGARTVDDATWEVGHYDSGSQWGHRPPAG